MSMRECLDLRAGAAALCLLWGGPAFVPAWAVTVDFESAAYVPLATLHGVDGWSLSSMQGGVAEAFRVQAETGNKVLRVNTAGINTVFKDIRGLPAGFQHLDVQWKWRATDPKSEICLGASSGSDNARAGARALACFHAEGRVSLAASAAALETDLPVRWTPAVRYALRMRLDLAANTYSLYLATDSLRSDEVLVGGPVALAGTAAEPPVRLVLRTEDGAGSVDVDDIHWENVVHWLGGGDGLAATAANWSGGTAPDSQTQVVFGARAVGPVAFDRPFAARSVTVEKGFLYGFNLGAATLALTGKGDFTGLKTATYTTGSVRMRAPRAQSLVGPENVAMPPLVHDGDGLLRLDGRPLLAEALTQTAGTLDLNGKDITVATHLRIQNGGPASVRGLGRRSLTVGRSARFEGAAGALLSLRGDTLWSIAVNDTLSASRAELRNANAVTAPGSALESVDLGGNLNWTFHAGGAPAIRTHPRPASHLVGETAVLKVSADGAGQPLTFQWRKDGQPLAIPADSVLTRAGLTLADSGSYACAVGNAYGTVLSQAAVLSVAFPAPAAEPGSSSFADSMTVRITTPVPGAKIHVSLDGGAPAVLAKDLVLRATTAVTAFAVLGKDTSRTGSWKYTRAPIPLEAPAATPRGRAFPDTLRIALGTRTTDARIHYTLDGRAPDTLSPRYSGSFVLDSTAVLRAISAKDGRISAEMAPETYELIPDSLSASPRGGDFPAGIVITLASTSRRATLYYTLDGSVPGPGNPASIRYAGGIRLEADAVLKAVAVAGQGATLRAGRVLTESYKFFQGGIQQLTAGETLDIGSRYSITNPRDGAPAVLVEIQDPDSLKSLRGFRDVQFALVVSLPAGAARFPELVLASQAGDERALYRMAPSGKVEFLSHEDIVTLTSIGTYFFGVDTLPPEIVVNGETIVEGDSSRIVFTVQDNVSSLLYDLEHSEAPAPVARQAALGGNPWILPLTLKSSSDWAPLWVRLRVQDRRNTRCFPADSAAVYLLPRKSAAPLPSPRKFTLGAKAEEPWDLIGFPLDAQDKLTPGALKAHNAVKGLEFRIWDPVRGQNRPLRDDEPILPGAAVWAGSAASAASLTLPPFQTAPRQGEEAWSITLKPGWNPVANPTLRPLIWPSNREAPGYPHANVKSLHGYDLSLPGNHYFRADTLYPWRGYFVLNKGDKDTVVVLRSSPVPTDLPSPLAGAGGAPKRSLSAAGGIRLILGLDRLSPLELGATPASQDGLGVEDEPLPPVFLQHGPRLWSARGRERLGTDYLRWTPGARFAWTVVATRPRDIAGDAAAGARVESLRLPEDYALFAVSAARGLKFDLSGGGVIPLLPGASDTLTVHAGPRADLESRLAAVPAAVAAFRLAARPQPGGYLLLLSLPQAAGLRWSLHGLDGRNLDAAALDLGPGHYTLPRRVRAGALSPGAYLLRLDWAGGGQSGREVRRLVLP